MGRRSSLWRHKTGQWATRIRGKTHYLGRIKLDAERRFRDLIGRVADDHEPPDTVAGLFAAFCEDARPGRWATRMLAPFVRWAGEWSPAQVRENTLRDYARWLAQQQYRRVGRAGRKRPPKQYRPKTIRHQVSAAARLLAWSHARGWSAKVEAPKLPRVQRERRDVAPAVLADALERVPARARRILLFIAESGCRPGEACRLLWRDVDAAGRVAMLADHKTAAKTGKPRVIPLTDGAMVAIGERPAGARDGQAVFLSRLKTPYTPAGLRSILRRAGGITPYQLRHSFAVQALTRLGRPELVAKFLGHESQETVWFYARVLDREVREAATRLGTLVPSAAPAVASPRARPKSAAERPEVRSDSGATRERTSAPRSRSPAGGQSATNAGSSGAIAG